LRHSEHGAVRGGKSSSASQPDLSSTLVADGTVTIVFTDIVGSTVLTARLLVSNLVRELVAGPGIDFLESREVELKGLDGSHRLFAVDLN
jgi:class 3 adenylate cyclase